MRRFPTRASVYATSSRQSLSPGTAEDGAQMSDPQSQDFYGITLPIVQYYNITQG